METKNSELLTALSLAQAEFPIVEKNRTAKMGSYSYKYADLTDIIQAIKPVMQKYKLSFSQNYQIKNGVQVLETTIGHASGEVIVGEMLIDNPVGIKPQEFGSISTYFKRYALSSALGISSDEDVDGVVNEKAKAPVKPREVTETDKLANQHGWKINEKQIKRMFAIASSKGLSNLEVKTLAEKHGHKGSSKDMLSNCYNAVCTELEAMPNKA